MLQEPGAAGRRLNRPASAASRYSSLTREASPFP
jgi:hypothetical protein